MQGAGGWRRLVKRERSLLKKRTKKKKRKKKNKNKKKKKKQKKRRKKKKRKKKKKKKKKKRKKKKKKKKKLVETDGWNCTENTPDQKSKTTVQEQWDHHIGPSSEHSDALQKRTRFKAAVIEHEY